MLFFSSKFYRTYLFSSKFTDNRTRTTEVGEVTIGWYTLQYCDFKQFNFSIPEILGNTNKCLVFLLQYAPYIYTNIYKF